ncbi:hypothetical protein CDAR_39591 [Caerostris darwini]|uniref:Uncharacterized protein n=1 Tax=Caerostris darwini TaxID=1538125 RepID=A0AAV4U6D5_9ARAC|nr:hypothetical protein CDAR_39591 [Caerostris darwini]
MDCAECEATIDYSLRGSLPDAITQLPSNLELMDTCGEGASPFQDHLKQIKTDDISKEEEQAHINCDGLRHSSEQAENHRRIVFQMKETYQSFRQNTPER